MSQSFDASTGTLDVNYAGYLSKHDVVFNHPITAPEYGSTVGNGRIGAMVWNKDGLNMQITGIDASEQTAFSAGLIHLYTAPGMDTAYSKFQQRLALYDGVLTTKYDDNRTITVMGSPDSEVMGIHVSDGRPVVSRVTLDLSIWDVGQSDGGDVPDIATWRSVATSADAGSIALNRGQEDPGHFGYTLAATVEGARFTTELVDARTVRLKISPSSNYTIWIACASRLNAPNHDSVKQADALLRQVEETGYAATLRRYTGWWHTFWQKSFVEYAGSTADDYLENLYYLYTYIIAAGSYATYPFHFIHGDFTAIGDADSTKWSVAYWYWNQRDVYNSFLASNHAEMLRVDDSLYSRNFDALATHTRHRYSIEGIWVPETMRWDGSARYTDDSPWTKNIFSTGAEVAESMYADYKYTADEAYLKATVYPFVRAVAQFYTHKLAHDADSGKFYMAMSNAHETYWDVKNAITDLAAIRSLFPIAIETSRHLDLDGPMRTQWQVVLDNLADYPVVDDGSRYAPHDPPAVQNRNRENVTSELVWPYGVTGIGAPDYPKALEGWLQRPFPYADIWSSDTVQAARLGLGDEVLKGMRLMIQTYQSYPNGLTKNPDGNFEYLGTHLSAINESLLQSYNDKIRVFPAPPSDTGFVGRFTLLARGGFLVSSEYENKEIKYVAMKSLYGHPATIENPWAGAVIRVETPVDGRTLLTTRSREFEFDTVPDAVYVIERVAKPLRRYAHRPLTGTANNDAKRLGGATTLGSFLPEQRPLLNE
jgi:hypothetical protein